MRGNSIILISYLYGDFIGTGSVRSTKFSECFVNHFEKVHVITQNECKAANGVVVSPVKIDSLKEKVKRRDQNQVVNEELKKTNWYGLISKLMMSFPTNLLLSEVSIFYIIKAVKIASEIIEKENVEHIFSSMQPYGDHYIAYLLKKKFPHIKWVADFRDLYIEPVYNSVYCPKWQRRIEQKILDHADIVTTVSNGLVEHLKIYDRPTYSVKRGMAIRDEIPYYEKFTISYTGSLFQSYRDPRPLFFELKQLIKDQQIDVNDLQIIYAGKDEGLFKQWIDDYTLSNIFVSKGLVTRSVAQTLQSKSHINLLLTSSTSEWQGVLTGKVFEYIESGNCTLCIIKGVKDLEFENLFKELNAGLVCYNPELSKGEMKNFILKNYNEWKQTGSLEKKVCFERINSSHSWDSRVKFILNKLAFIDEH